MNFCPECGLQLSSGTEKFCPNCGYDVKNESLTASGTTYKNSINIDKTGNYWKGDPKLSVIGANMIVQPIDQAIYVRLEPEFRGSLEDFLALINKHSEQLSKEQSKSLKESIDALAKSAEALKADEVVQDQEKRDEIKSTQITLADKIVNYLPKVAESIASVIPLVPFSRVIGEGTGYFAEWIRRMIAKKQT